jgi:hypothetical protein
MFAPAPKLAACLEVLRRAAVDARLLGWAGEREGLGRDQSKKLADLMDAAHNIPELAADWERCDEQLLRSMLGDYDARHGASLLETYDRVVAEHSRSS